jgi:hypothetical protein
MIHPVKLMEGGRSVVLHVSCLGPVVERALRLPEAKSRPSGLRHRLTRPLPCSPSLCVTPKIKFRDL